MVTSKISALHKFFVYVFMQGSEVRVNFVVMRATETQEEGGRGVRRPEPQYFRRRSAYMKVGPVFVCSERL